MEQTKSQLFQVYLRLRPPPTNALYPSIGERFLSVEETNENELPTHITLNPPNDNRRRAVEKFAFTKVFEEESSQLDLFEGTGVLPLVEGVLGPQGGDGRDGLLATLGVTGSGKSHTILGSRTQRGLTQLALDVLFRSISSNILDPSTTTSLHATVAASDPSEAQVMSAQMFLDTMYGESTAPSRASSRAPTPAVVRTSSLHSLQPAIPGAFPQNHSLLSLGTASPKSIRVVAHEESILEDSIASMSANLNLNLTSSFLPLHSYLPSFMRPTVAQARKYLTKSEIKGESYTPAPTPLRKALQRPSAVPQVPDISNLTVDIDANAEYAILISMYEVYNDRIFDLLTPALPGKSTKDFRRRPLLFKPTEMSPDRKVVAGLRKIICGSMKEALMVLEAGLHERRVAGTGSNSVSSRSHGFFCVEVKKRRRSRMPGRWGGSALTIVDLAGSERARDAKTQGATLQEAGKINESLMYLGQCLQMQSDLASSTKPNLVPFRQCKLTELLFSNSFPSSSSSSSSSIPPATPTHHHHSTSHRNPQKAIMIVTADPIGDFNATSQILRYSALAREITVPRIPSVTSTILASSYASSSYFPRGAGRSTPTETERETMEIAALEIARMSEEIDGLRAELIVEQERRMEVEAHLESLVAGTEERLMELEAEVREECYVQMETRFVADVARFKASWAREIEACEGHVDRKLEILTRTMGLENGGEREGGEGGEGGDEGEDKENRAAVEDLEDENKRLRREVELLRRDLAARSPSKNKMPLREIGGSGRGMDSFGSVGSGSGSLIGNGRAGGSSSSGGNSVGGDGNGVGGKKIRKLTARKWDLMDEEEVL